MGTISDKLVYLDETREKIKENLNKFGSNITENDTFRSYSNVINDIYDKLPKVSANGTDFALENAQNGKLDSFSMDGNTEQTTYSGKNLLAYTSYGEAKQGITTTYNSEDGALILNGTANNTFSNLTNESSIDIATGTYTFSIKEAKNYNIRLAITCTDNTTINATINKGSTSTTFNVNKATLNQRIFIYENDTLSGTTFTNEKIYAQLESGSTATSFEPFVGGTPSPNPDYPQDVKVVTGNNTINQVGKNLFNKSTITTNSYLKEDGTLQTGTGAEYVTSDFIPVQPNTTYYKTQTLSPRTKFYDANKQVLNNTTYQDVLIGGNAGSFTTPNNAYYFRFTGNVNTSTGININSVMVHKGSTATTFEPYQNQDYEIDLGDIELCKIGDYKDVIFKNNQLSEYYDNTLDEDSWYIKKEIGKVVLDGSEFWGYGGSSTPNVFYTTVITDYATSNNIPYSNYYIGNTNVNGASGMSSLANNTIAFINVSGGTTPRFYIKNTRYTLSTDLKTWLETHNLIVYYALITPTYETITDETLISQLESIKVNTGSNYFTLSNSNNVLPTLYVSRLKELGKLE